MQTILFKIGILHFPCEGYPFIAERGEQGGIAAV